MKALTKALIVFLAILFIGAIIAGITIYQGLKIMSIANDKELQNDIESLRNGDCSKLPSVQEKMNDAKSKIISGCKNPIIKIIIEKKAPIEAKNICNELSDIDSIINKNLAEINQFCYQNK